jgi:FkbM family methyltransferase
MSRFVKQVAARFGIQLRRLPDPTLPFIHTLAFEDSSFRLWIANEHAKAWWHKPRLEMNGEFRSLKELCVPGGVVLDVGAHHGITMIPLARWVGERGHVHAFEANPENALILYANAALNHLHNCVCIHTAVGAADGVLHMDGENVDGRQRGGRTVPVVSLDAYCQHHGIARVDLLKIDVEGFEEEVLKGARQVLATAPRIALELHLDELPRYGSSVRAVFELLDPSRYELSMLVRPDWERTRPLAGLNDLPACGVVNLFCRPRESTNPRS